MDILSLTKLVKHRIKTYKELMKFDKGYELLLNRCYKKLDRLNEMRLRKCA